MQRQPPARLEPARVRAVSVGLPRPAKWRDETVETGIFKEPVEGRVALGPLGFEGDGQADLSVHGGPDKAVYAYDESNLHFWQQTLGRADLGSGAFGENLTLQGLPDESVSIGDVLAIGGARLEVSQPRQPCFKLGLRFGDARFPKRFLASGRVGYYLRVLEPGEIGAGDAIDLVRRDPAQLSVRELVEIWTNRDAPRAELERAVGVEALAEAWRTPLRDRLRTKQTESHGASASMQRGRKS